MNKQTFEALFFFLNLFVKVNNLNNVHAFTNSILKLVFLIVSLKALNIFNLFYTNQHGFLDEKSPSVDTENKNNVLRIYLAIYLSLNRDLVKTVS